MKPACLLKEKIDELTGYQLRTRKPLAIILSGHNGSGKSTLWYDHLADTLKIPLINADRMMLSILPEPKKQNVSNNKKLCKWAQNLRDHDASWMEVAQKGVEAFVAQAKLKQVPFAVETVFSYWQERPDGKIDSKIRLIEQLQDDNYFVLLLFVGLASANLSIGRVQTRFEAGGHNVAVEKLLSRFARTQHAVGAALDVVDAAILVDNSFGPQQAFRPVYIRTKEDVLFDHRNFPRPRKEILAWLDIVVPVQQGICIKAVPA
jgi:predicted ABC-type ATPase